MSNNHIGQWDTVPMGTVINTALQTIHDIPQQYIQHQPSLNSSQFFAPVGHSNMLAPTMLSSTNYPAHSNTIYDQRDGSNLNRFEIGSAQQPENMGCNIAKSKIEGVYDIQNIIYQLLISSYEGISLLRAYEKDCVNNATFSIEDFDADNNFDELELTHENLFNIHELSRIIINNEFSKDNFTIPKARFLILAQSIAALFPKLGGVERWYTPSRSRNGIATDSRGLLWSKYLRFRKKAIALNFIEPRIKMSPTEGSSDIFKALREATVIDDEFLQSWNGMRFQLEQLFLKSTLENIFQTFQILKTTAALTLIKQSYEETSSISKQFADIWPEIGNKIYVAAVLSKKGAVRTFAEKMLPPKGQRKLLTKDIQNVFALLALPYLLGPQSCATKRKKKDVATTWRATAEEVQHSFITFIQNDQEDFIDLQIKKIKSKYEQHNLPFSSFIISIGTMENIKKSYVIIGDTKYVTEGEKSLLDAVDFCMKITSFFKKPFPKAAEAVWQYIQKNVYKMNIDSIFNNVSTFEASLNKF